MTLLIKIEDGACVGNPILEENFRQLFPNTSFPKYFTADSVEYLGYGIYDFASPPICGRYEKAVEVAPVRSENGIWRQSWQIIEMDDAEKAQFDEDVAKSIRSLRNKLLAESDWVIVKAIDQNAQDSLGVQIPQVWLDYRQALRDITSQAGFPHNVTWPEVQ